MEFRECLSERLRKDILEDLLQDYDQQTDPSINAQLSRRSFRERVERGIPQEFPELVDIMRRHPNITDRCCARVWDLKRGTQCKLGKLQDSDFCKKHSEQDQVGKLRLGRSDERKPTHNEKGELFDWDEGIVHLEAVFHYQQILLHRLVVSGVKC